MIDWVFVLRNALWLLGLSIVLATLSYASWRAAGEGIGLRQALARPAYTAAIAVGLLLCCLGLAWGALRLWERGLWLALALAFAWQAIAAYRARAGSPGSHDTGVD